MPEVEVTANHGTIAPKAEQAPCRKQCHFLNLPYELREIVYQFCVGQSLIYIRANFTETKARTGVFAVRWHNYLDWQNRCPSLFQLNKQINQEAHEAMLHNGVLDLWGVVPIGNVFASLPSIARHVKNIAVTYHRGRDLLQSLSDLPSIENVFVDSISMPNEKFRHMYKTCMTHNWATDQLSKIWMSDDDYNFLMILRNLLYVGSALKRKNPIKIYARFTTYHEEILLCVTDPYEFPKRVKGSIPKFEHKFSKT